MKAPGGVMERLRLEVPGPPVEVALRPADRLEVRVPELIQENLVATLTLRSEDGQAFETLRPDGVLQDEWRLDGGLGVVDGVPPGEWTLWVEAADGRRFLGLVRTVGGGDLEVVVR